MSTANTCEQHGAMSYAGLDKDLQITYMCIPCRDERIAADMDAEHAAAERIAAERGIPYMQAMNIVMNGEEPAGEVAVTLVDALRAELLDSDALDNIPPLEPLIDGVLWLDTVTRMNGPSGHGKSFVALDMAGSIGTGLPWHGRATTQGRVIYIAAEGIRGMSKRKRAWEKLRGQRMNGVSWLPRPVQARDASAWDVLHALCVEIRPALIVLDTQARVTVGIDENDNTLMGVFNELAAALQRETGACVLIVHHTGTVDPERGRGATAVKGALQTELLVTKKKSKVTIKNPKQKDDAEAPDIVLTLTTVDLGTDDAGRPVNSLVPTSEPFGAAAPTMVGEEAEEAAESLLTLTQIMSTTFHKGNGGTKGEVKSVVLGKGMSKTTFYRTWNELMDRGCFGKVRGTQSYRWIPVDQRSDLERFSKGKESGFYAPDEV